MAWIAKSNAEQRSGRAGRCRNGYCFRLYSIRDYKNMLDTQIPEMKRAAIHVNKFYYLINFIILFKNKFILKDVCLHAKMFAPENISVKKFLEMALEPPPPLAIDHSMKFLEQIGALYSDKDKSQQFNYYNENNNSNYITSSTNSMNFHSGLKQYTEPELTELGRVLAHLPLEPQCARLLLFGLALKCFNPIVTLVASLSNRDPCIL